MSNNRTIYELALEEPGSSIADLMKVTIARLAVGDARWCATYDELLSESQSDNGRHPENIPSRHDIEQAYSPILLSDLARTPDDLGDVLRRQAVSLTGTTDVLGDSDPVDLVAAVAAAEIWMAALAVDDLIYAAAKGPDAINAAGAILGRACGSPAPMMPFDPEWPTFMFPMNRVMSAAARSRAWVDRHLGDQHWESVAARVVTDLSYRAGGTSKTHEAALLLGVRMLEISPQG